MIRDIIIKKLTLHFDERGSFTELLRNDWLNIIRGEEIVQVNLSKSYPGIVRAWHRHNRGQNDYFICIKGNILLCAYDSRPDSPTFGELDEIMLSEEDLKIVRIPGILWHGFKVIGNESVRIVYAVNTLYDAENPDEERRPWNDPMIIPTSINGKKDDLRVNKPWNWNRSPHK